MPVRFKYELSSNVMLAQAQYKTSTGKQYLDYIGKSVLVKHYYPCIPPVQTQYLFPVPSPYPPVRV